jgi:hypothetical protein
VRSEKTYIVDGVMVLVTTVEKYEEQSAFAMTGRVVPEFEPVPCKARRQLSALQVALRSITFAAASPARAKRHIDFMKV